MNNILLVVLYNKTLTESNTLKSLMDSNFNGDLIIFNNGPRILDGNDVFLANIKSKINNVCLSQDISNRPLSIIYNEFLQCKGYDRYYFFDDDTNVTEDFFSAKKNLDIDVSVPIIKSSSNDEIYYPIVNNEIHNKEHLLNLDDDILTIGSGLMISKKLIDKFRTHEISLFNERYALYGVDFSLFRQVKLLRNEKKERVEIEVAGVLNHSLSRIDEKPSIFRDRERAIDVLLTKIIYPGENKIMNYLSIIKIFVMRLVKLDFKGVNILFVVLLNKSHPRTFSYVKKNNSFKF